MSDPVETALGESRDAATARVLERLRGYVEHESPTGDVERCSALADIIAADLTQLGAHVSVLEAPPMGKHVRAVFAPLSDSRAGPLLVIGHFDTVHPIGTLAHQRFTVSAERVTGPGVYDMKAGVALMLEAIALLQRTARLRRPIVFLFTCDEEVGSPTSRALIEAEARAARAVLVPEPSLPGGRAKTARKGVATYRITAFGRAAHAGIEPEKGVNAIVELAQQIVALQNIADGRTSTITVGTITGGTATNVVPAVATAQVDVRFATAVEGERIDAALKQLQAVQAGARLEIEQKDWRPPLERSAAVVALYQQARSIAHTLGFDLGEGSTGGGSDGCLTAALGIPTLDGLGVQGGGAHAIDEHVLTADLAFRLAFYAQLLERV